MITTEYKFRAKPYRQTYEYPEDQQYFDEQWQKWADIPGIYIEVEEIKGSSHAWKR